MKLKPNIDYVAFLFQVRKCAGEVWFCTDAGDKLNLKSTLSEYIFLSTAEAPEIAASGRIECENGPDAALLAKFVEAAS